MKVSDLLSWIGLRLREYPLLYTGHILQWTSRGIENSGVYKEYQPGKCADPEGQFTVACGGGKVKIIRSEVDDHDCQVDEDGTTATCSYSGGTLHAALVKCLGQTEEEVKLTATLNGGAASCEAEGASVLNAVFLMTMCEGGEWMDLDDECSAEKSDGSDGSRYVCYEKNFAKCSWRTGECAVSMGDVTVTSRGNSTCVHILDE